MSQDVTEMWTDKALDLSRLIGDPLADEVIRQIREKEGPGEARRIFDLLIRKIRLPVSELPAQARTFIAETAQLPPWADPAKIKRAEEIFKDHGPKFLAFLYYKSLPTLYLCKNGAQVLVNTGRLAHKPEDLQFSRRIAETGQFLIEVMAPGGLRPGGPGVEAIQKVRLIHASIRQFIPAESWDRNVLGEPINQEDMAITLLTFSISILDALRAFGIGESPENEAAYLHHWKVVGHILGVQTDLIPDSPDDGRKLLDRILERQAATSPEGIILTSALVEFAKETFHAEIGGKTPETMIRFLIGDRYGAMLGLENKLGCATSLIPHFLTKLFTKIEKLEDRSEPLNLIINQFSIILVRKMVDYFNVYKGEKFQIPASLKKAWKIVE